jgi:lactate/malate dehydrogenase, NAD binding domain
MAKQHKIAIVGAGLVGASRFRAGDYADDKDADIVFITAGAGVKPGQTRLDLAHVNARTIEGIVDQAARYAPDAVYIVATNPCDVLTAVIHRRLRVPREHVISTGTELDTARLRTLLSERWRQPFTPTFSVSTANQRSYIGPAPLFRNASENGMACLHCGKQLDDLAVEPHCPAFREECV